MPSVEILHRVRGLGYAGAKTALYEAVRRWRPRAVTLLVRFEGVPGEFSQHDFGQVEVRYLDGTTARLHFFASRLKYSRWVDVRLVEDERIEALVRSLLASFASFGGIVLVAVFDNPKTVPWVGRSGASCGMRRSARWRSTTASAWSCAPAPRPGEGVGRECGGLRQRELLQGAPLPRPRGSGRPVAGWHHEVNAVRPCRATGVAPAMRMVAERARLRPLAIPPEHYALRFPVMVGPTGVVPFAGYRYSMPPDPIGIPGTLWLYPERVRIVAGRHISEHARVPECGRDSLHSEHRTARLAKVAGARGRLYLKRQELLDLGPVAETFLTEIVHRHRFTWQAEVEQLHGALLVHGPAALHRALAVADEHHLYAGHHVLQLLPAPVR